MPPPALVLPGTPATAAPGAPLVAADGEAADDVGVDAIRAVLVLLNRSAGGIEGESGPSLRDQLIEIFGEFGVAARVEFVDGGDIEATVRSAVDDARQGTVDAIVVGGGDGSVRALASAVAGSHIPIGILPLGTLNHFARDVGLPLDLRQAVAAIASGSSRQVDLGEVNGRVFINNSSVGIYPYMVLDRDRRRGRNGLAKWTAMALALLRGLRRFPRRRLTVRTEDSVATYRTPCLFVGNNRYDLHFLSVGRRQALDAGTLHVYVARSSTKLGFAWFLLRAALGLAGRVNELAERRVTAAEISSRASRLPVALDGEVEILATPLRYRTRPGALTVILPPLSD